MVPRSSRVSALACFLAEVGALALAGCQDPTEIDLEVTTNAVCADVSGTSITVGQLGTIEQAAPVTSTTACDDASHRIGSLVVIPSGDNDSPVAVRVVTGIRRSPEECVANAYKGGCIVARRSLRYLPHTALRLPVEMTLDCMDVPCGQTETCVHGSCVSATIAEPETCATPGGCQIAGGDGGPADAATEASEDVTPADAADEQDAAEPDAGPDAEDAGEEADAELADADADSADSEGDAIDAAEDTMVPESGPDVLEAGDAPLDSPEQDAPDDAADALEADAPLVCSPGIADCDGIASNGCEAVLANDNQNCGVCGHDCFGGGCSAGTCLPLELASGQLAPTNIAVAGGYAYFTSATAAGAVLRVPIDGSSAPETVVPSQPSPWGIATDGTFLYWTTQQTLGGVFKAALDGSGVTSVALAQQNPAGVLVNNSFAYWVNQVGTVNKVAADGTGLKTFTSGLSNPMFLALAAGNIVVSDRGTKNNDGSMMIVPDSNATPWNLTSGETFPMAVATDGTAIVWVTRGKSPAFVDGQVRRHSGGTLTVLLTGILDGWGVALDPTWIYWTSQGDGRLERVARDGTQRSVMIGGLVAPCGVAVDDTAVYVASSGDGRILRIAK